MSANRVECYAMVGPFGLSSGRRLLPSLLQSSLMLPTLKRLPMRFVYAAAGKEESSVVSCDEYYMQYSLEDSVHLRRFFVCATLAHAALNKTSYHAPQHVGRQDVDAADPKM